MTHLLDTHTLILFLENDPQLPTVTRIQIQTTPTLFISSGWRSPVPWSAIHESF
jgi:PIN domain nuclease of toxin-antitoxin system